MITVYGINSCDSCRRARKFLAGQDAEHRFVDLRQEPVGAATLARWWQVLGEALINRRSTTWRGLDDSQRQADGAAAVAGLLQQHPTLIKRPVVDWGDELSLGFDQVSWQRRISP